MHMLISLGIVLATKVTVLLTSAAATPTTQPVLPAAMSAGSSLAPVSESTALAPGTPCADTARACVDLSANQAWLIRDGTVEYGPVRIAHGRKGYRTSPGTFRVKFKNRHHVSSIYDSPMPYSVFFNGGIAFHQGNVGQQSHGCIRLSRDAARTFFGSLNRGDVVQVVR